MEWWTWYLETRFEPDLPHLSVGLYGVNGGGGSTSLGHIGKCGWMGFGYGISRVGAQDRPRPSGHCTAPHSWTGSWSKLPGSLFAKQCSLGSCLPVCEPHMFFSFVNWSIELAGWLWSNEYVDVLCKPGSIVCVGNIRTVPLSGREVRLFTTKCGLDRSLLSPPTPTAPTQA